MPKTTRAMLVLPDRREPIKTILGARSARSLSPSEGVAGQRSRLAYMFLRARRLAFEWCFCGRAATARCSSLVLSGGAQGAQGVARRRRAKLQRLRLDDRLPEACLRVRAVQKRLRSGAFWFWPCLVASMLQDASCGFVQTRARAVDQPPALSEARAVLYRSRETALASYGCTKRSSAGLLSIAQKCQRTARTSA